MRILPIFSLLLFYLITPSILANPLAKAELPSLDNAPRLIALKITEAHQACLKNNSSAATWGEYALTLLLNNFHDSSSHAFKNAMQLDPSNYLWPYFLASIELKNSGSDALPLAKKATELNPDTADTHYLLSKAYEASGEIDLTKQSLTKAYQFNPDNLAINYDLGLLLLNNRQYAESKPYLLNAMQLAPSAARIRASLLRLAKVITIDPALIPSEKQASITDDIIYAGPTIRDVAKYNYTPQHLANAARYFLQQKNWQAAAEHFSLLEQYYDLAPSAQADYAATLTALNKYSKAENIYRALIKAYPKEINFQLALADLLFINRKPEAETHYQWVFTHAASDIQRAEALQGFGRIAASKGNLTKGLDYMLQAEKFNKKSADIQMDLVRIYADLKQFDAAEQHLQLAENLGMKIDFSFRILLNQAKSNYRQN